MRRMKSRKPPYQPRTWPASVPQKQSVGGREFLIEWNIPKFPLSCRIPNICSAELNHIISVIISIETQNRNSTEPRIPILNLGFNHQTTNSMAASTFCYDDVPLFCWMVGELINRMEQRQGWRKTVASNRGNFCMEWKSGRHPEGVEMVEHLKRKLSQTWMS